MARGRPWWVFGPRFPKVDELCHVGTVDGGKLLTWQMQHPHVKFILGFGRRRRERTSGKRGKRAKGEGFFLKGNKGT